MMSIWDKGRKPDDRMMQFTSDRDRQLDQQLLAPDLAGSTAHALMLGKTGLLSQAESSAIADALRQLYHQAEENKMLIGNESEDVHSFIEELLVKRLGETGKRIHSGRSRNDQVLVALRLYMRRELQAICRQASALFDLLIIKSTETRDQVMPGYTHMQVAMPSSFGLWYSAFAESLADDLHGVAYAYAVVNQNPLGSGAGYGTSFPVDREMTTRLLGFGGMNINAIYAQMTRGKAEKAFAAAVSSFASTLARLAGGICLYSGENFGFFDIPEAITTGSSIMPHKQNPDLAELIRGRCNLLQNLPQEITSLSTNLPTGYHRDLQLIKELVFPAVTALKECLSMTLLLVEHVSVRQGIVNDPRYNNMYSVEEINRLVADGVPFREAYRLIAKQISNGSFSPDRQQSYTHTGSTGNLSLESIREKFYATLQAIPFKEAENAIQQLMSPPEKH